MISKHRRKLMKILGGSAAMAPVAWSRPIVKSALLPVHAATSGSCFGSVTMPGPQASTSSLLDIFVKPVYASHLSGPVTVWLCIVPLNGTANVQVLVRGTGPGDEQTHVSMWSGNIAIDGNPHVLSGDTVCGQELISFQMSINPGDNCSGRVDMQWDEVGGTGNSYSIPMAPCMFPTLGNACVG